MPLQKKKPFVRCRLGPLLPGEAAPATAMRQPKCLCVNRGGQCRYVCMCLTGLVSGIENPAVIILSLFLLFFTEVLSNIDFQSTSIDIFESAPQIIGFSCEIIDFHKTRFRSILWGVNRYSEGIREKSLSKMLFSYFQPLQNNSW